MQCLRLKHWLNKRIATSAPVAEKFIHCSQFAKKFEVDKHCPGNHEHCLGCISYPNFFSRLGCCGLMPVKSTTRKSSNSCLSIWIFCSRKIFLLDHNHISQNKANRCHGKHNLLSCQTFFCKYCWSDISACEQKFINISKIKARKFRRPSHMHVKELREWRICFPSLESWNRFQQNKQPTHHAYTVKMQLLSPKRITAFFFFIKWNYKTTIFSA